MTTLTATLVDGGDAVQLRVSGAPAGLATLARRDGNGVQAVRNSAVVTGGTVTVIDHEVALYGLVRYLVTDSAGGIATAELIMEATAGVQIRRTYRPDVSAHPVALIVQDASKELRRSAHEVIQRDDVVYTTGRLGLRTGRLEFLAVSLTAAREIEDVYGAGQVVRLRTPDNDGLDMHHLGLSVAMTGLELTDRGWLWRVIVTYAESDPAAVATLPGWTIARLADEIASVGLVYLTYSTVADLAVDERPVQR